jgi:hypothetical protein
MKFRTKTSIYESIMMKGLGRKVSFRVEKIKRDRTSRVKEGEFFVGDTLKIVHGRLQVLQGKERKLTTTEIQEILE